MSSIGLILLRIVLRSARLLAPIPRLTVDYHHVQAIIVSIDLYAESALGNRDYFLNRPHGSGWKKGDVP
jgi:hypothetical protein